MRNLKVKQFESFCSDQYSLLKELLTFISRDDIVVTHIDTNIEKAEKGVISRTTVLYYNENKISDDGAERLISAILGFDYAAAKRSDSQEQTAE